MVYLAQAHLKRPFVKGCLVQCCFFQAHSCKNYGPSSAIFPMPCISTLATALISTKNTVTCNSGQEKAYWLLSHTLLCCGTYLPCFRHQSLQLQHRNSRFPTISLSMAFLQSPATNLPHGDNSVQNLWTGKDLSLHVISQHIRHHFWSSFGKREGSLKASG